MERLNEHQHPKELIKLLKMVEKLKKNQAKLYKLIKKIGNNNNKQQLLD